MKLLLALTISLFAITSLADSKQTDLGSKIYSTNQEINLESEVEKLYQENFMLKDSALNSAMLHFAKHYDATLSVNNTYDPVISVAFDSLIQSYSGKSGVAYYGSTYLAPLWLSFAGSGLIQEIGGWLVITDSTNLELEERRISIEKVLLFSSTVNSNF